MASIGQNTYHLKNYASRPAEGPGDKLLKILRLTWATSQTVDLSSLVRKGAKITYLVAEVKTVNATTGLITLTAADTPANLDEVDLLLFFDAVDLAPSSEYVMAT